MDVGEVQFTTLVLHVYAMLLAQRHLQSRCGLFLTCTNKNLSLELAHANNIMGRSPCLSECWSRLNIKKKNESTTCATLLHRHGQECPTILVTCLTGLSHEIYWPVFLPVCLHLGLNVNCFWFLNFDNVPSILDHYLKFWWVSDQTLSEILRILEKD